MLLSIYIKKYQVSQLGQFGNKSLIVNMYFSVIHKNIGDLSVSILF